LTTLSLFAAKRYATKDLAYREAVHKSMPKNLEHRLDYEFQRLTPINDPDCGFENICFVEKVDANNSAHMR
jgi:hypothetical protein